LNTLIFIKSIKFVGAKNAKALKSPAAADEGIVDLGKGIIISAWIQGIVQDDPARPDQRELCYTIQQL
jgi:hypothetical protein